MRGETSCGTGLRDNSDVYYGQNLVYETFANSEDHLRLIEKHIKPYIKDKIVLDVGCGTGKYIKIFEKDTREIVGLDKSLFQIRTAQQSIAAKFVCADASEMPFEDNYFDVVFSAWTLCTINSLEIRERAFAEIERVTKPGGKIIIVCDDLGGEFKEMFIDKLADTNQVTKHKNSYSNYLSQKGFKLTKRIKTYFKFKDVNEAQIVIATIFGNKIGHEIKSNTIKHNVIIFER